MLEDLKEEEIVRKVGGRFKLSTLIQKRLVQLNAGSRALVPPMEGESNNNMALVLREIQLDKIYLDTSNEVRQVTEDVQIGEGPELDLNAL